MSTIVEAETFMQEVKDMWASAQEEAWRTYTVRGYKRGVLMVEECSVEESAVQEVVDELESEGFATEVEES